MKDEGQDEPVAKASHLSWPREAPRFSPLGEPWKAAEDPNVLTPLTALGPEERGAWVDRFSKANISATRRNSPDLSGQLAQSLRRPIDTVICAVLDVDPAACLNSALASEFPIELAAAMVVLRRITGARNSAVINDTRVPSRWHTRLRRVCGTLDIRVEPIINDYPQAEPTLLLYSLLSRRLRPARLPTEMGVLLLDAAAAIALGRCALYEESMDRVPLVVRDRAGNSSHYAIASAGLSVADVFSRLGLSTDFRTLRAGDLLRDIQIEGKTILGTGELVIHSAPAEPPPIPASCLRCGWCADACPTRVHPAGILEASQFDDPELAERSGLEACIECGICAYVCPSELPLLQGIRDMLRKG